MAERRAKMKVTVLVGGSGKFEEYPGRRWGGRLVADVRGRDDPRWPTALFGKYSAEGIEQAVAEARRTGQQGPHLGGGSIVEVEVA
jgi:hypothetical protein